MGIRGAWTILSQDPRRFGRPWTVSDDEATETTTQHLIFLDGPSLLYYVAVCDAFDVFPPISGASCARKTNFKYQQVSSSLICRRITHFLSALLHVAANEEQQVHLHVVMDGLAPVEKIPSQVARLGAMAKECEMLATTAPHKKHKILPLLAEMAMVEAVRDLCLQEQLLYLHEPRHGEAETYIYQWLLDSVDTATTPTQHRRISIFSNDTDFLVYDGCPGFVPFSTLAFHEIDGRLFLSGFEYRRARFLAAFLDKKHGDKIDEQAVLAVLPAIVGCDYVLTLPKHQSTLEEARRIMVESHLGGLRPRQRNDPTMAAALTATFRFVAHWVRRCKSDEWKMAMAHSLFPNDNDKRSGFVMALQKVHDIYFPAMDFLVGSNANESSSVESLRLLECGILYCRPVIETWEGAPRCAFNSSPVRMLPIANARKRNSSKKLRGKRRKKRPAPSLVDPGGSELVVAEKNESHPASQLEQVAFPPCQEVVDEWLSRGSVWTMPHFCQVRLRLYCLLRQFLIRSSDADGHTQITNGPETCQLWLQTNTSVTEYRRVGRGTNARVEAFEVQLPNLKQNHRSNEDTSDMVLAYIFRNVCNEQMKRAVSSIEKASRQALLFASLMLPIKLALFSILLGTVPSQLEMFTVPSTNTTRQSEEGALLLVQVAFFHSSLVCNCIATVTQKGYRTRSCGIRSDLAGWIWSALVHFPFEDMEHCSVNVDPWFDQYIVIGKEDSQQQLLATWKDLTKELFDLWLQFYLERNE